MRKINTILSILLIVIFMLHGIMGSLLMVGCSQNAMKILAWIGVGIIGIHTIIGIIVTIKTFIQSKNNGNVYLRQNAVFWTRRASGLAIIIMFLFHLGLFGEVVDGQYVLFEFTTVRLIAQLLLVAALFIHIFVNVRPLLVSMGVMKVKKKRFDIFLVLSILVFFMTACTVVYYIGWL